jgi:hypothetical protein
MAVQTITILARAILATGRNQAVVVIATAPTRCRSHRPDLIDSIGPACARAIGPAIAKSSADP